MPSIPLHPRPATTPPSSINNNNNNNNPLPQLLQTPSGLAILEIQGTINIPIPDDYHEDDVVNEASSSSSSSATFETPIGKLVFPDYSPLNPDDTKWMKRVYLYVGRYQRMIGEAKKLAMPLAVIQRRPKQEESREIVEGQAEEELEIVEIVKYKLLFKTRPEPVS